MENLARGTTWAGFAQYDWRRCNECAYRLDKACGMGWVEGEWEGVKEEGEREEDGDSGTDEEEKDSSTDEDGETEDEDDYYCSSPAE